MGTHDNSVVPGKDGKLIEAGNKIPSSGCVASYEDTKREGGKGVHRIAGATWNAFRGRFRGFQCTVSWEVEAGMSSSIVVEL